MQYKVKELLKRNKDAFISLIFSEICAKIKLSNKNLHMTANTEKWKI